MAISTSRTLAQLQKQCKELGVEPYPARRSKVGKTEYVLALRDYYLRSNYGESIPQGLKLMLEIESPMLASQSKHLPKDVMEKMWNSNEWIAEEKIDGCRFVSYWSPEEWDGFSRNISVTDFLPVSYKDNFYLPNLDLTKIKDRFLIDSEIVCTNPNINTIMGSKGVITEAQLQAVTALLSMEAESSIRIQKDENAPLELKSFDCIWWNGEWLINKPYIERVKYLIKAIEQMQAAGIPATRPKSTYKNKKAFYRAILAEGGEGVILKNVKSRYIASSSRSKDGFVKVKRTASQAADMEGMGDTIDGFVTGFVPGDKNRGNADLVGALVFSTNVLMEDGTTEVREIASIAGLPLEKKKQMTEYDENGEPRLKSEWYGRVAEIDGQCFSARGLRLKHAVLVNWRPDKSENGCSIPMEFIKANVL